MYQLKQKPRYLVKNILEDLRDWAVEMWEEKYAHWSSGGYGSPEDYPDIVNYGDLEKDIYFAIKFELEDDFENEVRCCIQDLSIEDAERICRWLNIEVDNVLYDDAKDALMDDDSLIDKIRSKFIYRKLNIEE